MTDIKNETTSLLDHSKTKQEEQTQQLKGGDEWIPKIDGMTTSIHTTTTTTNSTTQPEKKKSFFHTFDKIQTTIKNNTNTNTNNTNTNTNQYPQMKSNNNNNNEEHPKQYFSPSQSKGMKKLHRHLKRNILVLLCCWAVLAFTSLIFLGPFLLSCMDRSDWCPDKKTSTTQQNQNRRSMKTSNDEDSGEEDNDDDDDVYENPDYITDPCRYSRVALLFYLTLEECDLCRRLFASVLFGGAIGYERRSADRPAGIRTMGLVSLGSCFFTISSQLAFKSSTMSWDSSRVSAAIPSGVGFLGAGLIWKGTVSVNDEDVHQVHGLTTAASVWLSAAVGVGAGGELYFVTAYSLVLVMLILRYGPKMYLQEDDQYHRNDDDDDDEPTEDDSSTYNSDNNYDDIDADNRDNDASDNSVIDLMMMKKIGNESIASLVVNMEEDDIQPKNNNNEKGGGGVFDIDANDIALLQAWKLRRQSMEDDDYYDENEEDHVDIGSLLDDMASDIMSKSSDLQSTHTTKSYGSNITPKSHHSMETNLIGNKTTTHTRSASSSSAGSNMKPSLSSSSLPRRSKNKSRKKKKQPFQGPSFHS